MKHEVNSSLRENLRSSRTTYRKKMCFNSCVFTIFVVFFLLETQVALRCRLRETERRYQNSNRVSELNEFSLNMIAFVGFPFLPLFFSSFSRISVCNLISLSMKICVETSPCHVSPAPGTVWAVFVSLFPHRSHSLSPHHHRVQPDICNFIKVSQWRLSCTRMRNYIFSFLVSHSSLYVSRLKMRSSERHGGWWMGSSRISMENRFAWKRREAKKKANRPHVEFMFRIKWLI